MPERLTKAAARNIFYGGSICFFIIFVILVAQSHWYVLNKSSNHENITASVERGKRVWEENSCINCHTIIGEGAYFAPELGNVFVRFGGKDDPEGAKEAIKGFIQAQPSGIKGRRQMQNFDLSDKDLQALADFFEWVSKIDTQGWPPNDAG